MTVVENLISWSGLRSVAVWAEGGQNHAVTRASKAVARGG